MPRKAKPKKRAKVSKPPISPEMESLFEEQAEAFRKKFGRDPGPGDPILFDPDSDTPKKLDAEGLMVETIVAMRRAGLPREFEYAYRKTGVLVTAMNKDKLSKKDLDEWEAAVEEYFEQEEAEKADDEELQEYCRKHPAFTGTYEFDLSIEMLGEKITRKMRADYEHTPEWEHWNLDKNSLFIGWAMSRLSLSAWIEPEKKVIYTNDDPLSKGPTWIELEGDDLYTLESGDMSEKLFDAIDDQCKVEDAKRRLAAAKNTSRHGPH